jgi:hypothetical protein
VKGHADYDLTWSSQTYFLLSISSGGIMRRKKVGATLATQKSGGHRAMRRDLPFLLPDSLPCILKLDTQLAPAGR